MKQGVRVQREAHKLSVVGENRLKGETGESYKGNQMCQQLREKQILNTTHRSWITQCLVVTYMKGFDKIAGQMEKIITKCYISSVETNKQKTCNHNLIFELASTYLAAWIGIHIPLPENCPTRLKGCFSLLHPGIPASPAEL